MIEVCSNRTEIVAVNAALPVRQSDLKIPSPFDDGVPPIQDTTPCPQNVRERAPPFLVNCIFKKEGWLLFGFAVLNVQGGHVPRA